MTQETPRLSLSLTPSGDELTVDLNSGEAAIREPLSQGVVLERDECGRALRIRFSGLRGAWLTLRLPHKSLRACVTAA